METIFTAVVVILAILAISDLIVGVSNDATNFLNSAIGSKAAPRYVIMTIATAGILIGSVFSSGMMEVARSGVFYPHMFTFTDIMMVFLAVMFTDVILLDLFNTFGLPTSTTVSLVFELLGSAVAVAIVKLSQDGGQIAASLSEYINTAKALGIISGILISVVVAFTCGAIVMFITRVIFSFNYKRSFKYFGAIWCGLALTAISYFVVFKGLKGSTLISKDTLAMLTENITYIVLGMIVVWSALMALLQMAFKVNILKITVLAGTFSLALAFAGNDLVNFIGVFMAGFDSYHLALSSGDINMTMEALSNPVTANTTILLIAGTVMGVTLWFSKKARVVTDTEVNLAKQDSDGTERFSSTGASRGLVRMAVNINKAVDKITPSSVTNFINGRFSTEVMDDKSASFDLIRATVNLTLASLLIALATSLKLPLSTTYVTFMVAMGSSLADKAWGRESAVYRVTGVITVVSGWFLTAFIAFTIAFVVATLLMYGEVYAIIGLCILCAYRLYVSNFSKKKRSHSDEKEETVDEEVTDVNIIDKCNSEVLATMGKVIEIYGITMNAVYTEDLKALKRAVKDAVALNKEAHERNSSVHKILHQMNENYVSNGHYYLQVVDYMNEMSKALVHITKPSLSHIDNNHTGFTEEQIEDLKAVENSVTLIYSMINEMLSSGDFSKIDETLLIRDSLFDSFAEITKKQIMRIKDGGTSTRASMLYINIISETKTMILQSRNLLKAQKHFISKQ